MVPTAMTSRGRHIDFKMAATVMHAIPVLDMY
jgi:hypothetical protein